MPDPLILVLAIYDGVMFLAVLVVFAGDIGNSFRAIGRWASAEARWIGRGLRDLINAVRSIFQPPPTPLPAWARRLIERIRR
jgi:hypothetical protein